MVIEVSAAAVGSIAATLLGVYLKNHVRGNGSSNGNGNGNGHKTAKVCVHHEDMCQKNEDMREDIREIYKRTSVIEKSTSRIEGLLEGMNSRRA